MLMSALASVSGLAVGAVAVGAGSEAFAAERQTDLLTRIASSEDKVSSLMAALEASEQAVPDATKLEGELEQAEKKAAAAEEALAVARGELDALKRANAELTSEVSAKSTALQNVEELQASEREVAKQQIALAEAQQKVAEAVAANAAAELQLATVESKAESALVASEVASTSGFAEVAAGLAQGDFAPLQSAFDGFGAELLAGDGKAIAITSLSLLAALQAVVLGTSRGSTPQEAPAVAAPPQPMAVAPPMRPPAPTAADAVAMAKTLVIAARQATASGDLEAAQVQRSVAELREQLQLLDDACRKGDYEACDNLSYEEEAKRAWLAKKEAEAAAFQAATGAVVPTGAAMAPPPPSVADDPYMAAAEREAARLRAEEAAKRAWLAKNA